MSTIKSSSEDLTLNADGLGKDIKFQSNGVEKASLTDAGVFTATSFAGSGASLTNLPSHSGNVAFPATQVASADANTLDDYEEGTWTPAFNYGTGTFTTSSGLYRKIGAVVFADFWFTVNTIGTSHHGMITGLPYFCSSAGGAGINVTVWQNAKYAFYYLTGTIQSGVDFRFNGCTSALTTITPTQPTLVNGTLIQGNMVYGTS